MLGNVSYCKHTVPISRRMNLKLPIICQKVPSVLHSATCDAIHLDTQCQDVMLYHPAVALSQFLDANHGGLFMRCSQTIIRHQKSLTYWLSQPLMECARKRKLGSDKPAGS